MLIRTATADDAGRLLEIYSYYVEKDTFSKRVLSPEPKFVKNKRTKVDKQSISEMVSTSEKEKDRKMS